jgi:non-specific protein-tyrosine kinase
MMDQASPSDLPQEYEIYETVMERNMELKKALGKAVTGRQGSGEQTDARGRFVEKRSPVSDWQPPVYRESTHCRVVPGVLRKNRCVCIDPAAPELENYKVLRTRIQQATKEHGHNMIMITSPSEGEGKTTTTVNLGLTFAMVYNQTVLMMDCDLRRQGIQRMMGIESDAGLVDYLVDSRPLSDFIIWPGIDKLTLISGGRGIQNSAELLGSERMKDLVIEMKTRYSDRYVLLDTPPVLLGADSLTLAPLVDGIVVVAAEGRTTMNHIRKTMEMLPKDKILGFVLNRQRADKGVGNGYA